MPSLTRGGPRLLRQVKNADWARPEDHIDPYPTPSSTNSLRSTALHSKHSAEDDDDVDREPDSSSDEAGASTKSRAATSSLTLDSINATFSSQSSSGKLLNSTPNGTDNRSVASGKRSEPSSEDDNEIFRRHKKQKVGYGRNIHAPPAKAKSKTKIKIQPPRTYSSKGDSGFKVPQIPRSLRSHSTDDKPTFRQPPVQRAPQPTSSTASIDPNHYSPHLLDTSTYDHPASDADDPATDRCTLCGAAVTATARAAFAAEHHHHSRSGRPPSSYKWQRRFCRFHRQQTARDEWRARGYPEIAWATLERRLRRCEPALGDVLDARVPSVHREKLRERLKSGRGEGGESAGGGGSGVGYYGPRGEKVMIDYIVLNLADRIRARAADDELVAAAGVRGGVSGFVQAVLVPHLVELLVKQDMKLKGDDWEDRARKIISDSAELGELVHHELELDGAGGRDARDVGDEDDEEDEDGG